MKFEQLFEGIEYQKVLFAGELSGVTRDTRTVTKDGVFVCIRGEHFDGHDHAQKALDAGATVVVCEKDLGLDCQIIVPNSRWAYAVLCGNFFGNPSRQMKMVGVTGTNGKTTVTSLIKQLLTSAGYSAGLIGTIQHEFGDEIVPAENTTPDAYELHGLFRKMVDAGCQYCVMEVSSHALDQYRVGGVEYDVAVFTNLTQDHLDYHKTFEEYYLAKRKLFEHAEKAIINVDDTYGKRLYDWCAGEKRSFSTEMPDSYYRAEQIAYRAGGVNYRLAFENYEIKIDFSTPGHFSVYNSMAAAAACVELGVCPAKVAKGLEQLRSVKGRGEVLAEVNGFTIVCDYAHSPDGLENILPSLRPFVTNRLITVFGCGGDRDKTKRPLMGEAAARHSDFVIITSDNPRSEDPDAIIEDVVPGVEKIGTPYHKVADRRAAIYEAIRMAQEGDIIVLAGKGHEDYQVLKEGKIHLDEREVVQDALKEILGK